MLTRAEWLARYKVYLDGVDRTLRKAGYPRGVYGMSAEPLADEHADEVGEVNCLEVDRLVATAFVSRPHRLLSIQKRRRRRRRSHKKQATSPSCSAAERDAESSAAASDQPDVAA